MLINHKKKFVFVHIQKTAGSSLTKGLKSYNDTFQACQAHTFIRDCKHNKDYFKFTIVRNPWDRLVSWYNMILKNGPTNNFTSYIKKNSNNFSDFLKATNIIQDYKVAKSIKFNQLDYITDKDGNILVDFIGKFENLKEDVLEIGNKIGIDNFKIPHINKFNHKDYRTYYNDSDIELVQELYKRDIDYFGYKFD